MNGLYWLPECVDFRRRLRALKESPDPWREALFLANHKLDFIQTNALDATLKGLAESGRVRASEAKPVRLALLGSGTLAHLHAAIRVAGLRRGISIEIYEAAYSQYWQELENKSSDLHNFKPDIVLFSFDAGHLLEGVDASISSQDADDILENIEHRLEQLWSLARSAFQCVVLQQTFMPVFPSVLGNNEQRLPGSRSRMISRLNQSLRNMSLASGVHLLAVDAQIERDGLAAWFDPALWYRSKQEVSLGAAPKYGDLVGRLIAALRGVVSKCLVLDLDNTLWGGVVGDEGPEGLVLGQGSALGEAYIAFQSYALELSRRGVILAVCSKNDEANAVEPFERHPEMVLRRENIACFIANWQDKVHNIKSISEQLNIGLDALVFVDDNPFERTLVRQELPMVSVPEVSDDPSYFSQILADAGYFEGLSVTDDDRARSAQYQGNARRDALKSSVTDLASYLRALEMQLAWGEFDDVNLSRIVQLINKTNQFNLTTRRYTEEDVISIMKDPAAVGLHFRLSDRFGDNGIIGIVIGRIGQDETFDIDTWLMSCRVLGRQVEQAMLDIIVSNAKALKLKKLRGEYIASKKNGMVKSHYENLKFRIKTELTDGRRLFELDLAEFDGSETFINITRV